MRTVCGLARRVQLLVRPGGSQVRAVSQIRPLTAGVRPLVSGTLGEQRRGGVVLDQVDGTTCGSAVLLVLAAWGDPTELARLDGDGSLDAGDSLDNDGSSAGGARAGGVTRAAAGLGARRGSGTQPPTDPAVGFGARFDARQKQVHRQTNRFWPQAMGTTPWSMVGWLRRHAPGVGPYQVRLVDDLSATDVAGVLADVDAALAAGRPVPLLVGPFAPRHYALVMGADDAGWRVYEPSSGSVRALDRSLVGSRQLAPVLGFDRLHAALLPV